MVQVSGPYSPGVCSWFLYKLFFVSVVGFALCIVVVLERITAQLADSWVLCMVSTLSAITNTINHYLLCGVFFTQMYTG
jgi:hypothetical protein